MKKKENTQGNGGRQRTMWFGSRPRFEYQSGRTGIRRARSSSSTSARPILPAPRLRESIVR